MDRFEWRPMRRDDLSQVMMIAAAVHIGYFEAEEVFAERLMLFPQGCRIAERIDTHGLREVAGYAFIHPTRHGCPPFLNQLLGRVDDRADCLHLHDVALLSTARGSGLGRVLTSYLQQLCIGTRIARAALVAVHESGGYWQSAGFTDDAALKEEGRAALQSYGEGARYMSKSVVHFPAA